LGESAIDTLLLKEERPAPRLTEFRRDAPEIIADLVAQCLEHDPAGRPASALELADRLDACLSRREPATIQLPTGRPRRRMGSPAWVLTSIAASCVMLAVFWAGAAPRATSIEHFGAVVMNPRSTIDASARVERPLLWTPVRPEAPPKAEVAPEITVPVGRVRGAHAALPSVEPEHANRPVPPPSAGTADCERSRQQAADARRAHDWTGVLRHSASARCWSSSADRLRLRVQAYMELGRFDRCLALGSGSTDADVQRFVTLCNHRRERAG
jgi:hypothetical protein